MKRWLAVVTASIGLVAFWALPPSVFDMPTLRATPERIRRDAVQREVARDHAALRAIRWSDSLSALLVETAVDAVALSPPTTEGLDPERLRGWVDAQHEALARLPRRDPDLRIGVFWVPVNNSTMGGLPLMNSSDEITFVGARDGVPYCFRAVPYSGRMAEMWLRAAPDLGPCRLYAAYGMPSEGIQAWLEASSLGFARVASPEHAASYSTTALRPSEQPLRLFGLNRPRSSTENLTVQACLAGRAAACERAMTEPELIAPSRGDVAWLVAHTPASSFAINVPHPPFGYLDDALLYEWEARYGSDAFARFWTS
ncbi:MAG TPA: hypothetical protein VMM35_00190, partial [Longimicrobiales bacterium]|nr:hypothetical protein [Longimicrobiales bacterium]